MKEYTQIRDILLQDRFARIRERAAQMRALKKAPKWRAVLGRTKRVIFIPGRAQ